MEEERQKLERDQETLAALRKEATELKKSEVRMTLIYYPGADIPLGR
jgi:hypothetical protein